ncbi:TonB-dependent receptor [Ulvibacter litoralis]|uniref:Iron complex outermembrane recepter protein n=1 Tax=Ulvibacter litoralis TaxID=227084 RepID=A0A1G7CTC5_9FLAO|nr:TonB-dependent receptor [Ulvibacter litoralis]GHC46145.1 TonB-dependent receptor [Ulvibacter litoralis]SDE42557.1 iron complex outermembrane recepter protein [Ulvibacter litoralis]
MKKLFISLTVLTAIANGYSQEKVKDSTSVEKLEEVLIQSVRVDADSPITHSNLEKEELEKRNLGQDIPYMLSYLPSVVTTSDAGAGVGYTYIRVRGSDASRVNVTLNGIPFNDAESQGSFFVNLPDFTSSVQSLQLQRGVGTSTNGSGAFGASLNMLTDGVSEKAYGEISNAIGSYNTRKHNVKFSTGLLSDHIELAGRLSTIQSDGYIDRATSDLKSYYLQGSYVGKNTLIKAITFGGTEETYQAWNGIDSTKLRDDRTYNPSGAYTDADGNDQFYDQEVDHYSQDHYQLLWNQRFNNKWSTNLALNYTYGRGYFEQYKEDESFEDYGFEPIEIGGETINTTDLIRRRWLNNNFYAANANVTYKDTRVDVTGGIFYSYYGGDHFGEVIWAQNAGGSEIRDRYYSGNGDKNEFTVFGKMTYRLNDQWSVFGDLQGRFVSYRTSGITSDLLPLVVREKYSFFNPKAGASFQLNDANQFYFSYGKANREPRKSDFEQGIFTAEKLDDFELGWRTASEAVKVNTNLFYMNYKDQLVLTGALDDVGAPIRATSGKSYRLGLEVDAEVRISNQVRVFPNIALSTNKNLDFVTARDGGLVNLGTTNTSFSPGIVAGNRIEYSPINKLQFSLLSKFVGEQYMGNIDSDASKLESYFIHDFNIFYTLDNVPVVQSIVFSGLVNNIFSTKYVSNGYFYTYDDDWSVPGQVTTIEGAGYYPQAEINFLVGATVKF